MRVFARRSQLRGQLRINTGFPFRWLFSQTCQQHLGIQLGSCSSMTLDGGFDESCVSPDMRKISYGVQMQELILNQAKVSVVMQILLAMLPLLFVLILVGLIRFWRAGFWSQELRSMDGGLLLVSLRKIPRMIDIMAQLAPMLGLLGTVLGMVEVFQVVADQEGGASPADMASGIWEALLTTAMGLIVAVPASLAAGVFEGMLERVEARLGAEH